MRSALFDHTYEKFWLATLDLADSSRPMSQRLRNVFVSHLIAVNRKAVPADLLEEYDSIQSRISSHDAEDAGEGQIEASLQRMTPRKKAELAHDIASLAFKLARYASH